MVALGFAGRIVGHTAAILLHVALGPCIVVGWLGLGLRAVRGETVRPAEVLDGFSLFVPAMLANLLFLLIFGVLYLLTIASIIAVLAVSGWFILLYIAVLLIALVPIIAFLMAYMLKYMLWPFALIDFRATAAEALKLSGKIGRGYRWQLAGLIALSLLLLSVAMIPAGLGLIVVGPWIGSSLAAAYESLLLGGARVTRR